MRHNKKFNHLGRKTAHRKAMLANMASSLIAHKRITTTVAKAKALRMYVEPLISKAKQDTTHSRRVVFSYLQDKNAVSELFREVAAKVADRPGGYTRILKTGNRLGDNAEMCIIELVDYNEAMLAAKEEAAKPKKRRSRRGGSKKADSKAAETKAPVAETEVAEETTVEEVAAETEVVEEAKTEEAPEAVAETEEKAEETAEEPKAEEDSEEDKKKEE
jgi:large subunit ribosomal protein L17